MDAADDVVFAQARFNVFRPNRWVTVAAGSSEDVVRSAAAGLYGEVVSPMGDTPYSVRVHTPEDERERSQAIADIAVTAAWGKVPAAG
jgi:hypothetical protein